MKDNNTLGTMIDFTLVESTPGISVILRPDSPAYTVVAISNEFIDFSPFKKEHVIGKSYFQFFSYTSISGVHGIKNLQSSFEYVVSNKKSHEIPLQRFDILHRDHEVKVKYWRVKNAPLLDKAGQVSFIIHTAFDITDVATAENNLDFAGIHKAYKFFMNAPIVIGYLRGEKHVIEFANEGLLKVWGKTNDVIGKSLFDVLPKFEQQGTKQLLDEVRQTGKPFYAYGYPLEFNSNGKMETFYFDFVYQPYYENDNQSIASGVIGVGHDVTEQIRARQLQKSLEELKVVNQNLEEFAYAASHDLKEPVRKILAFLNILKQELNDGLNERQIDLFHRLQKSTLRMQKLIDDLLEYSHAAKGFSEYEAIDLNEKVNRVLEDLELEIQSKLAKVEVGPLPTINGNRRQLQQLFQNLLSNAIKYSKPDTTPEIKITATISSDDEIIERALSATNKSYHHIKITDNGIGFHQSDAEKIFSIFTRLHTRDEYSGTGVGLSIVRKVVENHNGRVWAESEPGKGSTFNILLPV